MGENQNNPARAADLEAREKMLENRTSWLNAHDAAAERRDLAITEREELVQLREAQLEARAEVDAARAERDHLLVQIRDANERLVLASLQAQELAEDAIAARAAADDMAERFRSLIVTSSALIWSASAHGQLEIDSVAWKTLTGLQLGDDEWSWLDAVHPADRERVRDTWRDAVASAAPYTCQHRLRTNGGYGWVMARAVPIIKRGAVREWIGMMTDVTDRVRVEEARDRFIGILGHDLRNPLTSIVGGVDQLRDLTEPHKRIVARIGRSARRIDMLVRDLLDFARSRLGGGVRIATRPCDMATICKDVVDETRQAHPTRAIRFHACGDLTGEWDPDRIAQVMSNLVGNAVAHGLDPIVVSSHAEDEHVVTSIHNRGEPIPDALMSTLFEPFTRGAYLLGDGRATNGGGLGLGLYIASEIAHAHGGSMTVSSNTEEGTTFTLALPRIVPLRH